MTREEAISEWAFRSKYIKKWLDEYGEEPSIRHYVELIDTAIEALHREEAEEKGYCHRIRPSNVEVVVRCKDCRHSRVYQTDSKGTMQTYCVAFIMPRTVTDDDFCSWGERREPDECE